MSKKLYEESNIQAIAASIRGKNGSATTYKVSEMADAIDNIPTGGTPVIESKSINANGTYTAPTGVDGFSPVIVNVPSSSGIHVTSISRSSQPTKTTYKVGESVNLAGFAVYVNYSNGAQRYVSYNSEPAKFSVSPAVVALGTTSVRITYSEDGYSAYYDQSVTVTNYIESIAVTTPPTKLTYRSGDSVDMTGCVVTGTRSSGATETVTGWTFSPATTDELGTQLVTISYVSDSGQTLTTTQEITVLDDANPLESIAITTPPTKMAYTSGESLDPTGMVVTATYADTTTAVVPNSDLTFVPAKLKTTDTSVEVSYHHDGRTRSATLTGITVTGQDIDAVLDNNDWDAISSVSDEGANYWSVGDVKMITLNGTACGVTFSNRQLGLYILGFNHNSATEGTGITFGTFKTALTSGTDVAIAPSSGGTQMNSSGTNAGGWKNSAMRNTHLGATDTPNGDATSATTSNPVSGSLMAILPADLRAVMLPMTTYSDNTGGGSGSAEANVTATVDYIRLLSEFEVHGSHTYSNTYESANGHQAQYAYFAAGNSKVRYRSESTGSTVAWWNRSVYQDGSGSFCRVTTSGNADYDGASSTNGVFAALKV